MLGGWLRCIRCLGPGSEFLRQAFLRVCTVVHFKWTSPQCQCPSVDKAVLWNHDGVIVCSDNMVASVLFPSLFAKNDRLVLLRTRLRSGTLI